MTAIRTAREQPLYRQLEKYLREEIASGRLRPGDRLPAEPHLASQRGIARMTARQAIDALVQEGVLTRHRGRGTFVSEPRMAYPPQTYISFTRTMAALGKPIATKLLDFCLVPAHGEVAEELGEAANESVLFVRRLRFVDGEPVALHSSYMHRSYVDGLRASDLLTRPISEAMENVNGVRIVASRDVLEAAAASHEEASLLGILPGEPIAIVRGVAFSADKRPVLATRAAYRGDRFRFYVGGMGGVSFQMSGPSTDRDTDNQGSVRAKEAE